MTYLINSDYIWHLDGSFALSLSLFFHISYFFHFIFKGKKKVKTNLLFLLIYYLLYSTFEKEKNKVTLFRLRSQLNVSFIVWYLLYTTFYFFLMNIFYMQCLKYKNLNRYILIFFSNFDNLTNSSVLIFIFFRNVCIIFLNNINKHERKYSILFFYWFWF